eukprot:maker-scaffold63_size435493-snap-gene-0.17 protein:Tk00818 transcript:maker-scaffold63_size435493-snap-gene-0.17-mRNA-1 annotation:"hypothetical protein DAPPUDRAFT_302039"
MLPLDFSTAFKSGRANDDVNTGMHDLVGRPKTISAGDRPVSPPVFRSSKMPSKKAEFKGIPKTTTTSYRCNYCGLSPSNTYCLYQGGVPSNNKCGKVLNTGIQPSQKIEILEVHNKLRGDVAKGLVQGLPAAANMRGLQWNEELAQGAQLWANQCTFAHDNNNVCQYNVGQNLHMSWGFGKSTPDKWKSAILGWYGEVTSMSSSYVSKFPMNTPETIGHFTQMVWAETNEIGCGFINFQTKSSGYMMHVCNYGPAGNMVGSSIYESGATCSKCPSGTSCNSNLGLCTSFGSTTAPAPGQDIPFPVTVTEFPPNQQNWTSLIPFCKSIMN